MTRMAHDYVPRLTAGPLLLAATSGARVLLIRLPFSHSIPGGPMRTRRWYLATLPLALALLLSTPALSLEVGGTAWHFDGSEHNSKLNEDLHVTVTSGRKPLKGSSCCEAFVLAFPTS